METQSSPSASSPAARVVRVSGSQTKRCPECGQRTQLDSATCQQCEHVFQTRFVQFEETQLAATKLTSARAAQHPIQPTQHDRVAAGVLALFFGLFGMDGFYLGNTTMGLVSLVLFLVAMLLGVLSVLTLGVMLCVFVPFFGTLWLFTFARAIVYFASSDADFYRRYVIEQRWI